MSAVPAPEPRDPAYLRVPERTCSAGGDVADLASLCGVSIDDHQRLILDATYSARRAMPSYRTRRSWAGFESCVIEPRQNGKTTALLFGAFADALLFDAETVVWTAHRGRTMREAFVYAERLVSGNEWLSARVRKVSREKGFEQIEFTSGARIVFLSRSRAQGRGFATVDALYLDEALFVAPSMLGATMPMMSARPAGRIVHASSAGDLDSHVLRGVRDRGRGATPGSLAYVEYSAPACPVAHCLHAPGAPGCGADDPASWLAANPACPERIDLDYIRDERAAMPHGEFVRERLGWWPEPAAGRVIPAGHWEACASTRTIVGRVAAFAAVAHDRSSSVLAVAGAAGGTVQVEVARMAQGSWWVADAVADLVARHDVSAVGVRSSGPSGSLVAPLKAACRAGGVPLWKVGPAEFSGMCGALHDAVVDRRLSHRDDPRLNEALAAARRHQVADAWVWASEGVEADPAALIAVTGAAALFDRTAEDDYDPTASIG